MICSIAQPCYLGWDGYFDRIRRSDIHIVLDHVQFEKGSFTNRTRIRQRDGRVMWLTVPVEKGKPINETRVESGRWVNKHSQACQQEYGYAPMFPALPCTLDRMCFVSTVDINQMLPEPIETPCVISSWLGGAKLGVKSDLVLNLCKEVGATQYLSGPLGRNYLDLPSFERVGIEVVYHDFKASHDPPLSALDGLFRRSDTCQQQAPISSRFSPD